MKTINNSIKNSLLAIVVAVSVVCSSILSVSLRADGAGIAIDGLFDDWSDVPSTYIGYGGFNNDDASRAQLFTDGDYLYIHVDYANKLSYIPMSGFEIKINNDSSKTQRLMIYHDNSDMYNCRVPNEDGYYSDLNLAMVSPAHNYSVIQFQDTEFVYTIASDSDGYTRSFELKMKLGDLSNVFGMSPETISTISLYNPSLGGQTVSIAGSSSGPIIAVAIGAAIAVGSAFCIYRNNKKKESQPVE